MSETGFHLEGDGRVLVIAEVGNNHEGDVSLAERMIECAAEAGADAVKFQMIDPLRLVSPREEARVAQLRRFQLSRDDFRRLKACCDGHGVIFLATPFFVEAVSILNELVPAFKIASGDNDFWPLVDRVAEAGKSVLLSTGMTTRDGVRAAVERIRGVWDAKGVTPQLAVLHCVSSYPAPDEEANLRAIPGIAELGVVPGYSDHTLGIDACVAAVALGAKVIEKHFTIANDYSDFRDHQLSANPEDFAELVKRIRRTEDLLGGVKKVIAPCESAMVERVRRGIAAARDLVAGDRIMAEDLLWLRPRGEFIPGQEKELIGRILRKPVQAGSPFCAADLKAIDA